MSEEEIHDLAKELNINVDDVSEVILAYENQFDKSKTSRPSEERS